MDTEQSIVARVSGTVLMAFGVGLGGLAIWIVERQLSLRGAITRDAATFIAASSVLCSFCSVIGYRLTFNRPNRYNSVLSPTSWLLLALCIGLIGVAVATYHFLAGAYTEAFLSFAFGIAFVYGCTKARRAAISNAHTHAAP